MSRAAAGPIFAEAGLPTITPSATNPTLADNGWDTFHRLSATTPPRVLPRPSTSRTTLKAKTVFVIDDASEYGAGLADIVKDDARRHWSSDTDTIQAGQTDFSATVTKVERLQGRHRLLRRLLRRGGR